ncbi:MAG: HlyD family efflux transporter periplasmic adaptor subunit [Phycisphaerales bacterium]|nr:HlyD family efflux transporter periplasmic adaptor subunit [Phycisphaerales bacterium]
MNALTRTLILLATFMLSLWFLPACDGDRDQSQQAAEAHEDTTPTNRVAIPSAVRSNLGITFATAERRRIKETLRAPGRFEYLPTAIREYRTAVPGRVEVLVEQFQQVQEGDPLYRIDSPAWRELQKTIAEAGATASSLEATMESYPQLFAAHKRHERSLQESLKIWMSRVERLEALQDAGGGRRSEYTAALDALVKAEAELAKVNEEDVELEAARLRTRASLEAARAQFDLAVETAASFLDMDRRALLEPSSTNRDAPAVWRTINVIEVRAVTNGIVEKIAVTNGAWVEQGTNVVTVVQPDRLRFHASGLQSDLGVLRDGLEVTIVPPAPTSTGTAIPMTETMSGTLTLGLTGDADDRTVDLHVIPDDLADWARPGVTAQLEIVTDSTRAPELSIPLSAVQRDGLQPVIFRRAPDNPNEAIRLEADLGVDDGRWIAVLSGLRDGDQVVLDGGFQLMLATSGTMPTGGHFHADGTFHEGDH